MKYRASKTLVFMPDRAGLIGFNFLAKATFSCSSDVASLLVAWGKWATPEQIGIKLGLHVDEVRTTAAQLVEMAALVTHNSPLAAMEAEYGNAWRWGVPAAMLHFALADPDIMTVEESEHLQLERLASTAQPALFSRNDAAAIKLDVPDNDLIDLMARRRSIRSTAKPSITIGQLAECLFAGMGITGWTENCAGRLPLGMTPSGGARNPFEAYVLARNVEGLDPGIYHYSAIDHDLGRIAINDLPSASTLVGGQEWANQMPCLILLSASLDRTMWKYSDPNAYRVVLVEAGHIGQNIMLAATRHGLSACPTAALNHSTIKRLIGSNRLTDAPIYALTLGYPNFETDSNFH